MSRTIRENSDLKTRTGRERLDAGRQPHWHELIKGTHLGWQRWPKNKTGRWVLRTRRDGKYTVAQIGIADDDPKLPADNETVFTFEQARAKAVELSRKGEQPIGGITVARCCANYLDDLAYRGKNARDAKYAFDAHILPALGKMLVKDLTARRLKRFLGDLAKTPARRRTGRGREQKYKKAPADDEGIRQRRATANRVFGVLRPALNLAFEDGEVNSANAWLRVKPLGGAQKARMRFLSIDECNRLINAADPVFRPLARAALETGARYSELARLEVGDFNPDARIITVRKSKSGKPRYVVLSDEGVAFFSRHCAGRAGSEPMFTLNGRPWAKSDQLRPMAEACRNARLAPMGFHGLRHTYCSLCIMGGVQMMTLAQNVGHASTRMLEEHYAHLLPGFVVDQIRAGVPRFAVDEESRIELLRRPKQ